jgi:DNA-binding response OmpR family regulator
MSAANSILIIDDEPNLRRSLALILQREGYSVTTAGNAQEAHQCLEAGPFDLVFLDLKMPDVSGLDLLPEIRELYPNMPVLILTAHATLDSAIEAVRKGARDYLLKPIEPDLILARVREVLSGVEGSRRRREIVGEMQGLLSELGQIDRGSAGRPSGTNVSTSTDPDRVLQKGPFILDMHARYLRLGDRLITLSPTTFDYLVTLVRHSPDPVSYETLVTESQGFKTSPVEARDIARWRIHELRKSIEADTKNPRYIFTVRGTGYRLVA